MLGGHGDKIVGAMFAEGDEGGDLFCAADGDGSGGASAPEAPAVPGAEALCLKHGHGRGCRKAFMIGNEFAHVHPPEDGSLHMMLPEEAVPQIVDLGWAEPHPMAAAGMIPSTAVMVYGPRNEVEIETVLELLRLSYDFACGKLGRVDSVVL